MGDVKFSILEERLFEELDEPFRSRALLCAYRLREKFAQDPTVKVIIRDAWRDAGRQDVLYRQGRVLSKDGKNWVLPPTSERHIPVVTRAKPGQSPHEYRRAIHLILLDPATRGWLKDKDKRWLDIGGVVSTVEHVKWGGGFARLRDYAHIECEAWGPLAIKRGWVGLGATERSPG